MWHSMFDLQLPVAEKLLRTVIVYAVVAVLIRVSGKRDLAGLSTLDFVVMFLLSNVVQNAIIGDDLTITGGAIGAVTLVAVDAALNRLAYRSGKFSTLFNGSQTQVIRDGKPVTEAIRRLALTKAELEHVVRVQNGDRLDQVETGYLEPSGQFLLTLHQAEQGATKGDIEAVRKQLERIEATLARSV